ncbi:MAG: acetylxylan esterase [Clostridia bacterium]|nr:acetylxylan esterase [Clostridia bacterium]
MSFNRFLDGYRNNENELNDFICNQCERKFLKQENIKKNINTAEKWEKKKNLIKKEFLKSIGGLSFKKEPLHIKETGEINKDTYVIRKIVFESHKNFFVTGNLYIPKEIKQKVPAVLLTCGHSYDSKAEITYQMAAIELVKNKMVVFCIDPPGQGETELLPDRKEIGWGTKEHSYVGLACTLMGANINRYFIWNIMRAVDVLYTMDFIDKEKIGICGHSGGGTQASLGIFMEDRIKAAVISCYINGRMEYLRIGHAHDSEQNVYNCMGMGLDYADFITCSAPKPIKIVSVQYDFFPIEGAVHSFNKAKRIYKLYDKEQNVEMAIDKSEHNLTDHNREQLVKWFVKHFTSQKYVSCNPYQYVESKENLNCTKSGQVLYEYKEAMTLNSLIYQEYCKNKKRTQPLEDRIRKVINIKEVKTSLLERRINPYLFEGYQAEKIFWLSEENISVGGIYLHGKESNIVTYMMFEKGTAEIEQYKEDIIEQLQCGDVFIFDTRGIGAFKASEINGSPYYGFYGTMSKLVNDSLMAGTSFIEMQVNDILSSLNLTDKKISFKAYGKAVLPVLLANKLTDSIINVKTYGGITSFENIMKGKYEYIPEYEVFNMAKYFDIEELMV